MILKEIKNRVLYLTLNRAEKRNALNPQLVSDLKSAFLEAENTENVRAIVLKGNKDAFCAGADLEYLLQLQKFSYEENLEDSNSLKDLFSIIYFCKKPVIAQVEGPALAGGCGLVSVCDFVFASENATFGFTETRIGFIPAIVMNFLIRKIGEHWSKYLLISAEIISASKARELNLIHDVVESVHLEQFVIDFAEKLTTKNSSQAMQKTKSMMHEVYGKPLLESLNYAAEENAKARNSEDCKKGIAAFVNKEKISW